MSGLCVFRFSLTKVTLASRKFCDRVKGEYLYNLISHLVFVKGLLSIDY